MGISKLCCPVCWELLVILIGLENLKDIICGCHPHLSSVELPSWLPKEVLEKMIDVFQKHLHRALNLFMKFKPESTLPSDVERRVSTETISIWSIASGNTTEHHPTMGPPTKEEVDLLPDIPEF